MNNEDKLDRKSSAIACMYLGLKNIQFILENNEDLIRSNTGLILKELVDSTITHAKSYLSGTNS